MLHALMSSLDQILSTFFALIVALHRLGEHTAPLLWDLGNLRLNVKFQQVGGKKRTV